MSDGQDIDALLHDWSFQPGTVTARLTRAGDGREIVQMRIELGVLQMEATHRPDGERPGGCDTFLEHMRQEAETHGEGFQLSEQQCLEMDREFLQYYNRRICWLALREFRRAMIDADHTLALMDFVAGHSPSREWALSHEQYRPFVLFHRTQASALAELEAEGPERAIEAISLGLDDIAAVFRAVEAEEQFDGDDLVRQLKELQSWIREHYKIGRTLAEQLADAVAAEQYELAARLRDEISKRETA